MSEVIEYFFTPISGYAYLGHQQLLDIAARAGAKIAYCPVDIMKVFEASNTTPPAKQSDARRSYRQEDMARLAIRNSLPLNQKPKYWPVPGGLASGVIIAAGQLDLNQADVCGVVMKGVWVLDCNIADEYSLQQLLNNEGLPGRQLVEASREKSIKDAQEEITDDAIAKGVFGSPTYILENLRYWGQDRLTLLESRLSDPA